MITISPECIETYIAQQERNHLVYLKNVFDQAKKDNPALIKKLTNTVAEFSEMMLKFRRDPNVSDEAFTRHITINTLSYCMAVYHCIEAQLEINELKEQYGESTQETVE